MEILVVCGAGASSTFVAQRVKQAMRRNGVPYSVRAGNQTSLLHDLDSADLILLGPHLTDSLEDIRGLTAPAGTAVRLLPADIYSDLQGTSALALILEVLPMTDASAAASTRKGLS
ncbi:PTS sugar transporter subunit IIB [Nesterenkonia lutea]|uniref:PTS system cellobiose-specific IIB component n=1 Tax=Nesterenkonia lutea TaxID=272919 RepID=A0ABR9JB11_9MICC|nr:PTS sugar transporter [Nesterenkonia lutea]MBE1523111.1 PTS system cellobiose-specific IIB component [Nesterenkonia lutea]